MKLLQSFASKGFVRETFNWQWYYWYLTEEGITYLRQYLGIPEDIVPATLKQTASSTNAVKRGDDKEKSAGPGGEFNPRFQRGERGKAQSGSGSYVSDSSCLYLASCIGEGNREGGYRRQQGFGRNN
jgi:small subunit ribosomal protein S10e